MSIVIKERGRNRWTKNSCASFPLFFHFKCALICFWIVPLLFSPLIFAEETVARQENLYQKIPNDQPLSNSQEFVLLDDFSSGKTGANPDGWQIRSQQKSTIKLTIADGDGRNPKRGKALRCQFKLKPKHFILLNRSLNHLDVSQATSLILRVKLELKAPVMPPRMIILSLSDRTLRKAEFDITPQIATPSVKWISVDVPMKYFRSLDLDQLLMLSVKIWTPKEAIEGALSLDEIAFAGKGNLNFESSRDNVIGFPDSLMNETRRQELLKETNDKKFLEAIARDTWKYFQFAKNKKTQLIVDNFRLGQEPTVSGYSSPTNIAMDLMATVSAMDLGLISKDEALYRTRAVISSLMQMKRHKGFFFNFYETKNLLVTRPYISSVDNGWLAIALVVSRQAFKAKLWDEISQILDSMDFNEFYDTETNQMVIGYEVPEKNFGGSHYGMMVSEARAMSILAIGKGDIPPDHWWFLYRTPPEVWKWQNQKPRGRANSHDGNDYFQGYYEYEGNKFVPSWGGSLFEYLMPTLVLNEKKLAPESLGKNDRIATELHRDYAIKKKKYPVWGISPASVSDGRGWRYLELGIKDLGVKGYPDRGVLTPHVGFLALDSLPEDAIKNIRNWMKLEMYGPYGFFDTWDVTSSRANTLYLALDQGMSLVALCNYLRKGSIQERFYQDPIGQRGSLVLLNESFFKAQN